jgi:TRAP-type C4-dicarboxylate transport system permease small subunit
MNDRDAPAPVGFSGAIRRIEARLNALLWVVAVSLIWASAGLAFASVVLRYLFDASSAIVEELCRFSIVYAVLLYFGPLITRNAHLAMTVLSDLLPPRMHRSVDLVLSILLAVLLAGLLRAAWDWEAGLYGMNLTTMSGEMKAWVPSAALPIGTALALVYTLFRVVYRIAGLPVGPMESNV